MLTIEVPADPSWVAIVRSLAATLLDRLGVVCDDVYDASLVLGEMCSNVVRHAYGLPGEAYRVDVELTSEGVALTVTDTGRGMDFEQLPIPDPERPSGWGLWLVEQIAESLTVTRVSPQGTRVRAEMRLRYRASCEGPSLALQPAEYPAPGVAEPGRHGGAMEPSNSR